MEKQHNIHLIIATCPKPFIEPFNIIQQNAIKSWKSMSHPNIDVDILLLGNEDGIAKAARQLNCKHIEDIEYNQYGTPLVDSIFKKIRSYSKDIKNAVCCYINTDIITFDQFLTNIYRFIDNKGCNHFNIPTEVPYLLVGCRWDVDDVPEINFDNENWDITITQFAKQNGNTHGCWGIDYFIYSPDTFKFIYPFALGKFVWDRWLVGNVFRRDSITVDLTKTNFVIHQNGPWYQSSTGGETTNRKKLFDSIEVQINQSFDYYEKDVYTGTEWETQTLYNDISFVKKHYVPRAD